jgi:drug/metabolite transporter (DMT)-like permease
VTFGLPVALLAAAMFGCADFMGGLASRRASALTVTLMVSVIGALPVLALSLWVHGSPTTAEMLWGALAGVAGATGVTGLYFVLARGPVGVVAPVAALCGVAVPVLAGLALGERPTLAAAAGIACAAIAVVLISSSGSADGAPRRVDRSTLILAVLSGLGLGAFLVCIARIGESAGLMPLVAARGAGTLVALTGLALRREPPRLPAGSRFTAIAGSIVDGTANVLYLLVVRSHAVSIVGTIVSLGPAFTIVLARFVLHERFHRRQLVGLALAAGAVILLTGGF